MVARAAPATPMPKVKMNSGSRAMLSSVAAPWIMTGVFTLPSPERMERKKTASTMKG